MAAQAPTGKFMASILIVDDSLLIRTLLREIFEDAGHEVIGEADNGLTAPGMVRELRPQLVTLDLVMPGRRGIETLQHMLMIDPSLTVVVCSGCLDEQKVVDALRSGAKGFIVKPFTPASVLENVSSALHLDPARL